MPGHVRHPAHLSLTGYGYIHYGKKESWKTAGSFLSGPAFKEKPLEEQAGLFSRRRLLLEFRMFVCGRMSSPPSSRSILRNSIPSGTDARRLAGGFAVQAEGVFREMPATSIDYALMEKADGVVVCEGNFGWSDVGAWSSLFDVWKKDEAGNAFQGDVLAMDTAGTLCFNPGKFTALIGCRDLIVVDTPDALLICPRSQDQRVKQVLEHSSAKTPEASLTRPPAVTKKGEPRGSPAR